MHNTTGNHFSFLALELEVLSLFFFCWGIWKFPGYGLNRSFSCQPTPQPWQRGIQLMSVTYITARCKDRSRTHWVGPGTKTTSSWLLVRFISTEPQGELPFSLSFFLSFLTRVYTDYYSNDISFLNSYITNYSNMLSSTKHSERIFACFQSVINAVS